MGKSRWWILICMIVLLSIPGCGGCGAREKGKNSDFDRPRPTEKK
jgi:hypothetical protein